MMLKRTKNEFYTQFSDIENEFQHYKGHFANKHCMSDLRLCNKKVFGE
ncbi:adenine-specific methyltransferase EcoRI family protein [Helicobacter winghamensis]|nr:adenine-specific methyltransferase EcoRI family protein [Helicobacter winghamensis]